MKFLLRFRDALSEDPLMEAGGEFPLPVPAKGSPVTLEAPNGEQRRGHVDRVAWAYKHYIERGAEIGRDADGNAVHGPDRADLQLEVTVWMHQA